LWQNVIVISSQIVVNDRGVDYSPFNGSIVKGVSNLGLSLKGMNQCFYFTK